MTDLVERLIYIEGRPTQITPKDIRAAIDEIEKLRAENENLKRKRAQSRYDPDWPFAPTGKW